MPLLALVISPVLAAAILFSLLLLQDAVSIWAFRDEVSVEAALAALGDNCR